MKKVCVITGTRAEYGLLYWLMKELESDSDFYLQVIVTGAHLSPEFGLTYKEIQKDFQIDKKIEILLSSDTPVGISKSMGLAQISFSEAYEDLKPDMIVVLGDRYEIFSAVSTAMIARIPIIHISGGEVTEGAFDEAIRHSVTKMSHLHFTATEEYKNRVIQLGENPNRVFNVGGLGIDNIKRLNLLNREELEKSIKFEFNKKNILVTFHPVTLEHSTSEEQFQELLEALDELKDTNMIFTKANSDVDGRIINKMIDDYVSVNSSKSVQFSSLGQLRYLSTLKFVDAVLGNSSSGLAEAPSFKIGTINIGDRQKGRIKAKSIIDCNPNKLEILDAINKLYSKPFQNQLKIVINPYGNGGTSKRIIQIIKSIDLSNILKNLFMIWCLLMKSIENIKLNNNSTIKEALEIIGTGAVKIAIVVDENDKLIGTITDGDLRQAFLNAKTIDDSITDIYFKNPTVVDISLSKEEVLNICIFKKIYQIPVVDEIGRAIGIHILDELLKPKRYPNKVILMVGGLGNRLRPLTEKIPKPMLNVGGKPILQTIVEKFVSYGFENIIMCVNYKSNIIIDYFGDGSKFAANIEYVFEKKRMGTAGALSLLKERPKDPFFVMNGDLLTNVNLENLLEFHKKNDSVATMCVREYDFQVPYGVVNINDGKIKSIEEKPVHNFFVSAGIYMFNPSCLEIIPSDKYYDMPTLFETLIQKNETTISFPIREYWLDIGRIEEFEKANKEYPKLF